MNKAFNRVNWKNLPNRSTPLSATYLNRGDAALDTIDTRVVNLDTNKADKSTINDLVSSVTYNKDTGTFTIKKYSGATTNIDTDIEKLVVNFEYDEEEHQLVLYDAQHQEVSRVDLSDFITINQFADSDTIVFNVEGTEVSADIKNGSITADKLETNYLASIMLMAGIANESAESALSAAGDSESSATLSQSYAVGGTGERPDEDTDNAKYYKEQAEKFATSDYAVEARSYARGDTATREGEETDNAKYYCEQAQQSTITKITATVDENVGTPEVDVTNTTEPGSSGKSFRFDFKNIKGETGDKGEIGIGVADSYMTDESHLVIILNDEHSTEIDAGLVGTNILEMTKAEYEALPNDVKNDDGLYFWITDEDGGTMAIIVSSIIDYERLDNLPSINGKELIGEMSLEDLGLNENNLIQITEIEFNALTQDEKDDPTKWYWIV